MQRPEFIRKIKCFTNTAIADQESVLELLKKLQEGEFGVGDERQLLLLARTVRTYLGDIESLFSLMVEIEDGKQHQEHVAQLPDAEPGSIIDCMNNIKKLADETIKMGGNKSA